MNSQDTEHGCTPLSWASFNGHESVVKLLLENTADVVVASNKGWAPLISASSNGHDEVVKMLLEKGADGTAISKDGRTSILVAAEKGHESIITLLLDYSGVSKLTHHSLGDLLVALAYGGSLSILRRPI